METVVIIASILGTLGVPAIVLAIVNHFLKKIEAKQQAVAAGHSQSIVETQALKLGLQALLRHELYGLYDKAIKENSKSIDDLEDFENMYNIYHSLGANGVMDTIANEYRNKIELR